VLADRVVGLLADGRARTVPEIARAVRVRDVEVRRVLRSDGRFVRRPAPRDRSVKARLWALAESTRPEPRTNGTGRSESDAANGSGRSVSPSGAEWWPALP
jgi:hypothetical protein